jgi:hypothetical protein
MFMRPYLNREKLGMVVYACHCKDGGKLKIGGSWSRSTWAKSEQTNKTTTTFDEFLYAISTHICSYVLWSSSLPTISVSLLTPVDPYT